MITRPIVIIESPYKAPTTEGVLVNIAYARAALKDSLLRGESPFASHLLYTQPGVLDDSIPDERALGIEAGLAFQTIAKKVVVYNDLGITEGMKVAIDLAKSRKIEVEERELSPESMESFLDEIG